MEYYLCRAMEVCRLSPDELTRLHNHEKKEKVMQRYNPQKGTYAVLERRQRRCLMPFEIQEIFNKPLLKETYMIPEEDALQSMHNQRLRGDFRRENLIPRSGDLSTLDVESAHDFDHGVIQAHNAMKIDLMFHGGSSRKTRFKESFE